MGKIFSSVVLCIMISCSYIYSFESNVFSVAISSDTNETYDYLVFQIGQEAARNTGLNQSSNITIELRNKENKIIAGMAGYEFYGSLVIDVLWVDSHYRKLGIGTTLLNKTEEIARSKNLSFISVSTMEWWNCKGFYEKNGFLLEFTREGFDKNYKQYHLIKRLN